MLLITINHKGPLGELLYNFRIYSLMETTRKRMRRVISSSPKISHKLVELYVMTFQSMDITIPGDESLMLVQRLATSDSGLKILFR